MLVLFQNFLSNMCYCQCYMLCMITYHIGFHFPLIVEVYKLSSISPYLNLNQLADPHPLVWKQCQVFEATSSRVLDFQFGVYATSLKLVSFRSISLQQFSLCFLLSTWEHNCNYSFILSPGTCKILVNIIMDVLIITYFGFQLYMMLHGAS